MLKHRDVEGHNITICRYFPKAPHNFKNNQNAIETDRLEIDIHLQSSIKQSQYAPITPNQMHITPSSQELTMPTQ